ncbi:hypothetical protein ACOSQ2_003494 [Xanthoceras sorbifolium]
MNPSRARNPLPHPGSLQNRCPQPQVPLRHPEFNKRLAQIGKRTMIQEKGIDMDELCNTFVPLVVHQRG